MRIIPGQQDSLLRAENADGANLSGGGYCDVVSVHFLCRLL